MAPDRRAEKKAAFRFHHISTDEVYGSLGADGSFTETTPYAPNSPYSASKASSDHLVRAWYETYGLPVVLTNCSNNYGPYHFPEKLIPLTILRVLPARRCRSTGTAAISAIGCMSKTTPRALRLVVEQGAVGQSYNIGGHNERTNLRSSRRSATFSTNTPQARRPPTGLITFVADRPGHDQRYAIDPSKIYGTSAGGRPRVSKPGLRKTVRWYLDNRDWWQAILDRGYRAERVGLGKEKT